MPNNAMKPTDAGTERFCPVNHSPATPPTSARGIFIRMRIEFLMEPKLKNSSRNTISNVTGITTDNLWFAFC